jgi:tripartite-type tricarboxylate transporter receptor subunit TctC
MGEEMPMARTRCMSLLALSLAGVSAVATLARADDFYKGKTFTIVVGFSPGGGYDLNARGLARHLAAHIPGNPTIIVQNQPGAGSLTSVRSLDVTAAKDGTIMTIFNPGLVTQSIVQPDKVKLDFRKFGWIGVVTPDFRVCYGYGPNGVSSWDDMMHRKEFVLGSTARGSGNYINGATLREVFHAPIKQILGFPGSAEQRLAIERGELDGDCGSYSSIPVEWMRDGAAHPFVRFTEQRPPEIPETAAYIGSFATTQEQRQILDVLNASDEVGRPFVMSKQVPADRVAIIRKAFNETLQDKAFLADMEKQQLPVNPISGEEAEAIVNKMMSAPPAVVAKAQAIYE